MSELPPEGGNAIDIPARLHVEGDLRQGVEEQVAAVESEFAGTRIPLGQVDATAFLRSIDRVLDQARPALEDISRLFGVALEPTQVSGEGLFSSQREAALAYQEALRQVHAELDAISRSAGVGVPVTGMATAVGQVRRLAAERIDVTDPRMRGTGFTEEALRAMDVFGGPVAVPDRAHYAAGVGQAIQPGDVEQVIARAQASLSKVVLDGVGYQFDQAGGGFRRLDVRGRPNGRPIVDEQLLGRLRDAALDQAGRAVQVELRAQLDQLLERQVGFAAVRGVDPFRRYGDQQVYGTQIVRQFGQQPASAEQAAGTMTELERLGITARDLPEVFAALRASLTELARAEGEAAGISEARTRILEAEARAEEQASEAARLRRTLRDLPDSRNPPALPEERERLAGQPPLPEAGPGSGGGARSGGGFPTPAGGFDPEEEWRAFTERMAALDDELAVRATARLDAFVDALPPMEAGLGRLVQNSTSAAAGLDAVQSRLERLAELTPAMLNELGGLTAEARNRLLGQGSALTVEGRRSPAVRTPTGEVAVFGPSPEAGPSVLPADAARAAVVAELAATTRAQAEASGLATRSTAEFAAVVEQLSVREQRLELAERRYMEALASGNEQRIIAAAAARQQAAAALEQERAQTVAASRAGAQPAGFVQNVLRGFTMARDGDGSGANAFLRVRGESGEFLGAIARYQAAYAIIFGLTRGFSALVQAEIQTEDESVEFGHAIDATGDRLARFGDQVARVAAQTGQSGAAGIQAATRGIFAFGDQIPALPADPTPADRRTDQALREQVGIASAHAAIVAQYLTGAQDIVAAQSQVIAATTGFDLGFEGQMRVLDATANAARHYGAAQADVLQGLSQIGEVAHQAGLSVEESANIIALAVARSGQTGTGVVSLVNRALGNLQERPDARNVLASMGVDTGGQAGQVLENLAHRWRDLSAAQREQALTALGGHEVARALLPILQEGDRLLAQTRDSYASAGYAQELYFHNLRTLGGFVRQLGGDFQLLGHTVAETGLLGPLEAAIALLHPLLQGVDELLQLVDLIPDGFRQWTVGAGEVLAVLLLIGRAQARNLALQQAQNAATAEQATGEAVVAAETTGARRGGLLGLLRLGRPAAAVGAAETAGAEAVSTGGAAAALTGLASPAVLLTAGLVGLVAAVGATTGALHAHHDATEAAADAERRLADARTVDDFRAAASALGQAHTELQHANAGVFGRLTRTPADEAAERQAEVAGRFAVAEANRLAAEQQRAVSEGREQVAGFFAPTGSVVASITGGLAAMTSAGVPAYRQLELLAGALGRLRTVAGATATQGPRADEATLGPAAVAGVGAARTAIERYLRDNPPTAPRQQAAGRAGYILPPTLGPDAAALQTTVLDPAEVRRAIDDAARRRHLGPASVLDVADQQAIASAVGDDVAGQAKDVSDSVRATLRSAARQAALQALRAAGRAEQGGLLGNVLSRGEYADLLLGPVGQNGQRDASASLLAGIQARAGQTNPLDPTSSLANLRAANAALGQIVARGISLDLQHTEAFAAAVALHDQVLSQLDQAWISQRQQERQALQAHLTDPAAIARVGRQFFTGDALRLLARHDITQLIAVMDQANQAEIAAVQAQLDAARDVTEHAVENLRAAAGRFGLNNPDLQAAQAAAAAASGQSDAYRGAARRSTAPRTGGSYDATQRDTPAEIEAARLRAEAAAGTEVAQARAALRADQVTLAAVHDRDSVAYWQAWGAVQQDKRALADAELTAANAADAARVRPGNQLSAAAEGLRAARRAVAETVRGSDAWWQAQQQLAEAQYSYGQAALEHAHQVRLAGIDITDPVATAREALREAEGTLRRDRSAGTGDVVADRNAVVQARLAAQQAAFGQRLQDAGTAHDLGTLSDAAYLRFLEAEDRSLRARIAGMRRTGAGYRQAVDELTQVDQAIKAATDSLAGQFNIGDIRIPTPYEVRRYIAESSSPVAASTQVNDNRIAYVSVATQLDRAAMLALLDELLGSVPQSRYTTQPRRS